MLISFGGCFAMNSGSAPFFPEPADEKLLKPMSEPTVLLITNIPTPYRIPLFNELNAQLAAQGIGFKVVFAALGYPRRKWAIDMTECAFSWQVLNGKRLPSRDPESAVFTYSGLWRILDAEPDALVIVGGFSLATMRVWLRSFYRKTRYIIWSGAIDRKDRPDSPLQRLQRRLLVGRAKGFVAYGTRARDYLTSLGAAMARVSIAINTVDASYFRDEAARLRVPRANGDRKEKRILYVGNLESGKRIDLLLQAIAVLGKSRNDFVLEIVGSGSQENYLEDLAARLAVGNRVRFHGFLQRPDVAHHLANALCFVFPSEYDIWGLVLVEAMAAALPCVSSIHAGATDDLIQDSVTGFVADFSQTRKVADILEWLLDHSGESRAMGERASAFIAENVNLQKSATGFSSAVKRVLGYPQTRRHASVPETELSVRD